jgi:hypothetical protein
MLPTPPAEKASWKNTTTEINRMIRSSAFSLRQVDFQERYSLGFSPTVVVVMSDFVLALEHRNFAERREKRRLPHLRPAQALRRFSLNNQSLPQIELHCVNYSPRQMSQITGFL